MSKKQCIGQCALCRRNKEIQLSHIIPHFVGKKLIKTSPGSIRCTSVPNQVVQDIDKRFLLCHDCEERFSISENWFAQNLFTYIDNVEESYSYDERLTYFIVSLSWRTLYLDLGGFLMDQIDPKIFLIFSRAEQLMRDYLLGKSNNLENIENHIFFLDQIQECNIENVRQPNVTMHRSLSSYSVYNGKTCFTVSNLMGILLVTFYSMADNEEWENTKIIPGSGVLQTHDQRMKSVVEQEIRFWDEQAENASLNLSESQRGAILKKLDNLGKNIKNYPIFQDWVDDTKV